MMDTKWQFLFFLLSYLLGNVSASYWIGKWRKNIDIRDYGSGNPGTTNSLRILGKRAALMTLLCDFAKGFFPVLVVSKLLDFETGVLAGVFAVIGHNWPVFMKWKGGKGVATSLGVLVALDWRIALISLGTFVIIVLISKYVSLGSILAGITASVTCFLFYPKTRSVQLYLLILSVMIVYKHKSNIFRLVKGEENKIGKRREL